MNTVSILLRTRAGLAVLALLMIQALNVVLQSQGMPQIPVPSATQPTDDAWTILQQVDWSRLDVVIGGFIALFLRSAIESNSQQLNEAISRLKKLEDSLEKKGL